MMPRRFVAACRRGRAARAGLLRLCVVSIIATAGCGGGGTDQAPPVATPSVTLAKPRASLGSPVGVTYRFTVAADATPLTQNYRVMVHFLDADEELMWTDDHEPAVPTTQWKPGQAVEYERTVFIPIYPYIGQASIRVGLYSATDGTRLPLAGKDMGQREYEAATIELLPQSENVFLIYKDGWQRAEVAADNPAIEWQWTKQSATVSFRNPRRDCVLYLHLDGRPDMFEQPQQVTVRLGAETLDQFPVDTRDLILRRIAIRADQLGDAEMADLVIDVDKTFVPGQVPGSGSNDPRELGVRVFHVFIEP
jgi:hypothetical protein